MGASIIPSDLLGKTERPALEPGSQGWAEAFASHGYWPHPSNLNPIALDFTLLKIAVDENSFMEGSILEPFGYFRKSYYHDQSGQGAVFFIAGINLRHDGSPTSKSFLGFLGCWFFG